MGGNDEVGTVDYRISAAKITSFDREIAVSSGVDVAVCAQCSKCACGCPVTYAADYTPEQIMHAINLGLRDLALGSEMIWLCASCEVCGSRCPQGVDIVRVMDTLRSMALQEKIKPKGTDSTSFYRAALHNIRFFGRMYEPGLGGCATIMSRRFGRDLGLGFTLLKKGKLRLLPGLRSIGKAGKIFSRLEKPGQP
jgi:heterodisulfide reductase subunit C2